jgi:hypothetical protein
MIEVKEIEDKKEMQIERQTGKEEETMISN